MTKTDMVDYMAEHAGMTKASAELAVHTFLEGVKSGLLKDGKVAFIGFGSFHVSERGARAGKNPSTGESIKIPPRRVPVFKAGATLKEAVAEGK